MNVKTLLISGMTALSLAAPILAHADPEGWRGGDRGAYGRGDYHGDRGHDGRRDRDGGRGYGWRGGDRGGYERERWDRPYRWGYERRCWVENRGYYEPDGDYEVRPIQVCR